MSNPDILTRLWLDVINPDPDTQWMKEFLQRPDAARHPVRGARDAMLRVVKTHPSRELLGRVGRVRRYEVCFGILYALDDPGVANGKLAGLSERLAAGKNDRRDREFF